LQDNSEQISRLKKVREVQLSIWCTKKVSDDSFPSLKLNFKEERLRIKSDTKDTLKNKVATRHSDINGQTLNSSNKHKTNFKRKMST
jgi:hypothetical protein